MAHLFNTVTASTPIVCGGLIAHIATRLPGLGFRDSTPIDPSSLLSIQFLKNAKDILFDGIRNGANTYLWNLFPNPTSVVLYLPTPGLNVNLLERPHYCLPSIIPDTIVKYVRKMETRQAGRRVSEEEESEEEGESQEEEEDEEGEEEDEEQQDEGSARTS